MADTTCQAQRGDGGACRMHPLTGSMYCWSHDPTHAAEAAEARRRGGLRKSKEQAIRGAYDVEGMHTLEDIRRVAEIAIVDTLLLDNSAGRSRTLLWSCGLLLRLVEISDVEGRLTGVRVNVSPTAERGKPMNSRSRRLDRPFRPLTTKERAGLFLKIRRERGHARQSHTLDDAERRR